MTDSIFEVVIYKVRNVDEASAARSATTPVLAGYEGFIGWRQLVSCDDPHTFDRCRRVGNPGASQGSGVSPAYRARRRGFH